MVDQEIEFEFDDGLEEEEEEEEETRRPSASTRKIVRRDESFLSKHDLLLIILAGVIGFGICWLYNRKKAEPKNEKHFHHYMPPFTHYKQDEEAQQGQDDGQPKHLPKHPELKKQHKRGGYYLDKSGDAHLEKPHVSENWVITRDLEGSIIDAYRIEDTFRIE